MTRKVIFCIFPILLTVTVLGMAILLCCCAQQYLMLLIQLVHTQHRYYSLIPMQNATYVKTFTYINHQTCSPQNFNDALKSVSLILRETRETLLHWTYSYLRETKPTNLVCYYLDTFGLSYEKADVFSSHQNWVRSNSEYNPIQNALVLIILSSTIQ